MTLERQILRFRPFVHFTEESVSWAASSNVKFLNHLEFGFPLNLIHLWFITSCGLWHYS